MAGKNHALARRAGAIDAVVAAMRAHIGNADVSIQVCTTINNICKNGTSDTQLSVQCDNLID